MKKDIIIHNTSVYHSYPDDTKKHPGLILIEEIWGVNAHIRSVADRLAAEGFNVLAPELLPEGVLQQMTPEFQKDLFDPEKRHKAQPQLREAMAPIAQPEYAVKVISILRECVEYLMKDPHVNGNVGVMGFCFGGTYSFHLAANDNRIKATVAFYGQPLHDGEISKISSPVLAFYGSKDEHLMQTLPAFEGEMKKAGKTFEAVVYEQAGHAFFNDTNMRAYVPEAAKDAWNRALLFLQKNLS